MLNCIPIHLIGPKVSVAPLRLVPTVEGEKKCTVFSPKWMRGMAAEFCPLGDIPFQVPFPICPEPGHTFREISLLALLATSAICPSLYGGITVFRSKNQHIAAGDWSAYMDLLLDQIPKTFLPSPKLSLPCNLCSRICCLQYQRGTARLCKQFIL